MPLDVALWKAVAPYSPCLTTSMRGPISSTARAAWTRLVLRGEHAGFSVVDEEYVEALEHFEQRGAMILDPVIHGVAGDELDACGMASRTRRCNTGSMLARKRNSESR